MKFSVIIPTFNKSNTIAAALDSILAQTNQDFEIIVVNDGSTDNIENVISCYPNVVFINKRNGGVSSARNAGLDMAKGEYICFLDADDIWLKSHLAELSNMINTFPTSSMYVTSHYVELGEKVKNSSDLYPPSLPVIFETDNFFELLNMYGDGIINTNSVCIKRNIIDNYNLRFDEDSKLGEDVDMWFRVALRTSVGISKLATTRYRKDFSTATKNGTFTETWKFAQRNEFIKNDSSVPKLRKYECLKMIDRNRLYTCRILLTHGNIIESKKIIKQINYKSGLNYHITKLLLILPHVIVKKIINLL